MPERMKWPDNAKPADYDDMHRPLREAFEFCYDLTRKNIDKDMPWAGLPQGRSCSAACFDHHESLTVDSLAFELDDQGRDALDVLIRVAIQVGLEQGRRSVSEDLKSDLRMMRVFAESAIKDVDMMENRLEITSSES